MEVEGEVFIKDAEKNNDLFKGKDNVVRGIELWESISDLTQNDQFRTCIHSNCCDMEKPTIKSKNRSH